MLVVSPLPSQTTFWQSPAVCPFKVGVFASVSLVSQQSLTQSNSVHCAGTPQFSAVVHAVAHPAPVLLLALPPEEDELVAEALLAEALLAEALLAEALLAAEVLAPPAPGAGPSV